MADQALKTTPDVTEVARQERLFCYVQPNHADAPRNGGGYGLATDWEGNRLGFIAMGLSYKSPAFYNYSRRRQVTLYGDNGLLYHGVYFESSGDYARLKLAVRQPIDYGLMPLGKFDRENSLLRNPKFLVPPAFHVSASKWPDLWQLMRTNPLLLYTQRKSLKLVTVLRAALRQNGLDFHLWREPSEDVDSALAELDMLTQWGRS